MRLSIEKGGNRIHELLQATFEAVQISRASPIWLHYTKFVSNVVLEGLKMSILKSLFSTLRRIDPTESNTVGHQPLSLNLTHLLIRISH